MSTIYKLRSSDGILKAILPHNAAVRIFEFDGEWRTANYESGKMSQFVINMDTVMTVSIFFNTYEIFLWEGDKIDLDNR